MTNELRKTKAALLAVALTLAGILLIMANAWIAKLELGSWEWLHALPLGELGGTLFGAGFLGTIFEYGMRKEQQQAVAEQFDAAIRRHVPTIRDAVVEGFAINPDDLRRVATPELLDDLAANAMSLRLGDEQFAREIYADIRDQAIKAAERWHDVEVRIRLSSALERSTGGAPLFDVVVEVEYTTIPSGSVRRFACVSDRAEYEELLLDVPATSPWFLIPPPGMTAADKEAYELLELSIDGVPQRIRRTTRKSGQFYEVTLDDAGRSGKPVRVRHLFRTITRMSGHRLYFALPQPARGMAATIDYTDTPIAEMRVIDIVSTARPAIVTDLPEALPGRVVSIEAQGWLMPKTGFAFTWTLDSELPRDTSGREAA
ncbi:hypothetical protein [Tsukamurella tyrosinosolvens]|uniref:hypothetical protein n=1 Tax=Tsukamurella tyrosinosolvens TaxID=57704 RepID=UPI0021000B92|nr:hypothetical protein [Tsukamurella tyrosinosolvens]